MTAPDITLQQALLNEPIPIGLAGAAFSSRRGPPAERTTGSEVHQVRTSSPASGVKEQILALSLTCREFTYAEVRRRIPSATGSSITKKLNDLVKQKWLAYEERVVGKRIVRFYRAGRWSL